MQRSCSETLNKILHMFFQLRRPTTHWQARVIKTGSSVLLCVSFLWIFLEGILESVGGFCFLGLDDCYDWGFESWWNYNNAPCVFKKHTHVLCKDSSSKQRSTLPASVWCLEDLPCGRSDFAATKNAACGRCDWLVKSIFFKECGKYTNLLCAGVFFFFFSTSHWVSSLQERVTRH